MYRCTYNKAYAYRLGKPQKRILKRGWFNETATRELNVCQPSFRMKATAVRNYCGEPYQFVYLSRFYTLNSGPFKILYFYMNVAYYTSIWCFNCERNCAGTILL